MNETLKNVVQKKLPAGNIYILIKSVSKIADVAVKTVIDIRLYIFFSF